MYVKQKYIKIALVIIVVWFGISTTFARVKVLQANMLSKNPTEYLFCLPKDSLRAIIISKLQISELMMLTISNKNIVPREIADAFSVQDKRADIFLWAIDYYCLSKIYSSEDGSFFKYDVSFYIHFESISTDTTKVIIETFQPKIVIGRELLPYPPHFVRKDKTLDVKPSTIEEYEILLKIGNLVNEKNMPALILPIIE